MEDSKEPKADCQCPLGKSCEAGDIALCKKFWKKCMQTKQCELERKDAVIDHKNPKVH